MRKFYTSVLFFLSFLCINSISAQDGAANTSRKQVSTQPKQRCFTTEYYNRLFSANPVLKTIFEANQLRLASRSKDILSGIQPKGQRAMAANDTLTIVIHVIGDSTVQSEVTDAVLSSQIDILNEDYQAANADSTRIPDSFKPLHGIMNVTYMLAQTDPDGMPTTGIERRMNSIIFNNNNSDDAKSYATGGMNAWDPTKYINLWVISFGNSGILGISVFPGDPRPLDLHGVVCDYRAFGRGGAYLFKSFDKGRTISHELGHFFNLTHIWGDDNGACTGTDFPNAAPGDDDTPNQGDATYGNPDLPGTGTVVTDACSSVAPGIMYQNYMDYTDDIDLVMFTKGQAARMETALTTSPDRRPLLSSTAYRPPVVYTYDARLKSIALPSAGATFCTSQIAPKVVVRNLGSQTLQSVTVNIKLNNSTVQSIPFNVNLAYGKDTVLTLSSLNALQGTNTLQVYTTNPNGNADEQTANDTAATSFKILSVYTLNSKVEENFIGPTFPPANWDIRNPDNDTTWSWNANIGYTQPGSAWFNDYNNPTNYRHDDLVMPNYSYRNIDSIFLTFHLAAAVYSDPSTTTVAIDTLSVLLSRDCGNTFTTIYKKWGKDLQTTANPNAPYTDAFFPSYSQWRKDTVNLGQWLGSSEDQFQLSFRFSGNYENNLFLDDVDLYTKVLPERLKKEGLLILPTAFHTQFAIWHYQQPVDLKNISIYNSMGQIIWSRQYSGNADKYIPVDLTGYASGIYIVRLHYKDKSKDRSQKIVKY